MSSAKSGWTAGDADVSTEPATPDPGTSQSYLDAIADADEAAVKAIEETIAHLKDSLAERRAQAKASRSAARAGQG